MIMKRTQTETDLDRVDVYRGFAIYEDTRDGSHIAVQSWGLCDVTLGPFPTQRQARQEVWLWWALRHTQGED